MPDRVCLRSPETGEWVTLAGTAGRIWEKLDYPASAEEVATSLGAEYEAPAEVIKADVDRTIAEFRRLGLASEQEREPADRLRNRYLSLLKQALVNMIYPELELRIEHLELGAGGLSGNVLQRYHRDIAESQAETFQRLLAAKRQGLAPLRFGHTMIGLFRLTNIERCAERVIADSIPGDFLEAGVCQGGAVIFMRALQVALGASERRTWVVDSFEGVPPSLADDDAGYDLHLEEGRQPWLACSEETVREHFRRYDLLDSNVRFLAGWIADTLPRAPIESLAILRIDVDLYSSTAQCLDLLYDRVSPGGFIIVDDYGLLDCCRDAVDDFRARRGVTEPMRWVDCSGIYWRKNRP